MLRREFKKPRPQGGEYHAECVAPPDACHAREGVIRLGISRKRNPQFKPNAFQWEGNTAKPG